MNINEIRTFYLFHNEDAVLSTVMPILKGNGFDIEYIIGGAILEGKEPLKPNTARLITRENILILSLFTPVSQLDLPFALTAELDIQGIKNEGFLGKVSIITGNDMNWQQALNETADKYRREVALNIEQDDIALARLGWLWPDQEAVYFTRITNNDPRIISFLDHGLVQIEASALKLHTISELYLSQSKFISEEKHRLDRALSDILSQQSKLNWTADNLPDTLEDTLHKLSNTYVVLSGYYRVIREAHNRISSLLASLRRRINREPIIANQRVINSVFLEYYVNRLSSLREQQKDIQSSLSDHQAAIEMMQGRIDVMNSRENLRLQHRIGAVMELNTSLQEQSLTFQIAASLIEFIILAYYSLSLFKYLAPDAYHHVPAWALFILFSSLAGELVMATHVIAERIMGKHHRNTGSVITIVLLVITLVIIFFLAAHA